MKFCKDCAHYRAMSESQYDRCEKLIAVDPVRGGQMYSKYVYCSVLRNHDLKDTCGPDAKWFDPVAPMGSVPEANGPA